MPPPRDVTGLHTCDVVGLHTCEVTGLHTREVRGPLRSGDASSELPLLDSRALSA